MTDETEMVNILLTEENIPEIMQNTGLSEEALRHRLRTNVALDKRSYFCYSPPTYHYMEF